MMPRKEKNTGKHAQVTSWTKKKNFIKSTKGEENSALVQNEFIGKNDSNDGIVRDEQIFDGEVSSQNTFHDEISGNNARVGAFNVAGVEEVVSDVEELSLPDRNLSMTQPTSVPITNARIVDDDIVNAVPLEGFLLKVSTRCKIISVISLLLVIAMIIFVIILIVRSSEVSKKISDADVLKGKLRPLLTAVSRQELEDNESATSLAFDWLVNDSISTNYTFTLQIQRFALAQFFYSTEGESWNQSTGWLTDNDVCSWFQTDNASACVNGTLRVLSLKGNNLNGSIPVDIGLLNSLEVLELSSNRLTGSVPTEIKNITSLKILDLQQNSIGPFPESLPLMLTMLQLSENKMDGMLPKDILTDLTMLESLDVSSCNLTCDIPDSIKNLTSLEILNLENNALGGMIPTEVGLLKNLKQLKISVNSLDGSIPSEIGQCMSLTTLELSDNTFDGSIPSEIGQISNLRILKLNQNFLDGSIPTEISQCTKLTSLRFDSNYIDGSIPSEIGALTALTGLNLEGNVLTGSIPGEIGELTELEYLHLFNNSLVGTIPESLCDVAGLSPDVDEKNITCSCCTFRKNSQRFG
jgi:hypothetical protein